MEKCPKTISYYLAAIKKAAEYYKNVLRKVILINITNIVLHIELPSDVMTG